MIAKTLFIYPTLKTSTCTKPLKCPMIHFSYSSIICKRVFV